MPKAAGQEALSQLLAAFRQTAGDDTTRPTWNTQRVLRRMYYERTMRHLERTNSDYRSLIRGGWVKAGNKIAVSSIEHAIALRNGTCPVGTTSKPSPPIFVAAAPPAVAPAAVVVSCKTGKTSSS